MKGFIIVNHNLNLNDRLTEIKLIDPKDIKKYIDWKEIGDRILAEALKKLANYKGSSQL